VARELAALALATLMLLSVALVNGFPLVDFDTSRYIDSAFSYVVPPDRPVFYSLFLRLSWLFKPSLWATVLLQSLLTALVIRAFLRARGGVLARAGWTVAVVAFLTLFTNVAWYTGYVMADLFTGLMFLSLVTLLADPRPGWRTAPLLAVMAAAAAVHNSNPFILVLLLLAAGVFGRVLSPAPRRAYGAAWATLAVALLVIATVNARLGGGLHVSRNGHMFLLARWIGDGSVPRMLDERCAIADYALCPHREALRGMRSSTFLWTPGSPKHAIDAADHSAAVTWPMLRDTLRYRPLDVIGHTLANVGLQLLAFRTGWNIRAFDDMAVISGAMRDRFPEVHDDWQRSLQQQGRLRTITRAINWLHYPVAGAAMLLLLAVSLPAGWPGSLAAAPVSRLLARMALAFIVINAAICAGLSVTTDRYGGRAIWPAVLVALEIVGVEPLGRRRRDDDPVRRAA
jgi:hypothetical protein